MENSKKQISKLQQDKISSERQVSYCHKYIRTLNENISKLPCKQKKLSNDLFHAYLVNKVLLWIINYLLILEKGIRIQMDHWKIEDRNLLLWRKKLLSSMKWMKILHLHRRKEIFNLRVRKRFLTDTKQNLYLQFCKQSKKKISRTLFFSLCFRFG